MNRVSIARRKVARAGYKSAILISACVLHDEFGLSEDELVEYIEKCETLRKSMDVGIDNYEEINKELERITGLNIIGE